MEGRGADEPLTPDISAEGRQLNRRIHLLISKDLVSRHGRASKEIIGDIQESETQGESPIPSLPPAVSEDTQNDKLPSYDGLWLAQQNADFQWLVPAENDLPAEPSTPITIKHHIDEKVELLLNGQPVPKVNFEGTMKNNKGPALSMWLGVNLTEGDNQFEAIVKNRNNQEIRRITRIIHYSGPPVTAELVSEKSVLVADGKTSAVIAFRLLDRDGKPARRGIVGQYTLNEPYRALRQDKFELANLSGAPEPKLEYRVERDGIVKIMLEPTTETGDVKITLPFAQNRSMTITARLKPKPRDWILVGLAEGTAGHNQLSGHIDPLQGNEAQNHLYQDGRVAFYAKGQVLGKWLLTAAYDSDKAHVPGTDPQLFQKVDPNTYYTVYGDTGFSGFDSPSSEKLYVKFERDEFYLMFGDFRTELNDTKLTRYERTLTGVKSRYTDDKFDVVVFTSETNQAFVRDEFRGLSSTGPYQLSRQNIALNSESVTIETRDRFHGETALSEKRLSRHIDYDINYVAGTIVFREPVFSTDSDLNPLYIIVRYESYSDSDKSMTYGGHASAKVNENMKIGVTHVNEGRFGPDSELNGIDLQYKINPETDVRLEAARSLDYRQSAGQIGGNAYLAEVEHRTGTVNAKAYYQEKDSTYGLSQSSSGELGLRKTGVEADVKTSDHSNIRGQGYHQETIDTGANRDLLEAQGQYRLNDTALRLGLREVRDEYGNGAEQKSDKITAGASQDLFNHKITARIDHEHNFNDHNSSTDYPDRTRSGVDYHINQNTTLFVEHELTNGELRDTRDTVLGIKSSPWDGGQVYSGLTDSVSNGTSTVSAKAGINQKWQLNKSWSLDVGSEQSRTLSSNGATPLDPSRPYISGGPEDFTAESIGLTYHPGNWLWTGHLESRNGDITDRYSFATSAQTAVNHNLSLLVSLSLSDTQQVTGSRQKDNNIGLGAAYRPDQGRWIFLDKLEFKISDSQDTATAMHRERIINNFNANYKIERWQVSLQYGAKAVTDTIAGLQYSDFVDLTGFETRYDLSRHWDIGVHGSILHAWDLNHYDYHSGVSIGHDVADNIWISLGYNFVGFHDSDFSRANYTSKGTFLKFRLKFDQQSVKEGLEWLKN